VAGADLKGKLKGIAEKVRGSKKLKILAAGGIVFILFLVLGAVAVVKNGGLSSQTGKTTLASDTASTKKAEVRRRPAKKKEPASKTKHSEKQEKQAGKVRKAEKKEPQKKEPQKTAVDKKKTGSVSSVVAEKGKAQPVKTARSEKKSVQALKPEHKEPDNLFKSNPFAQFYILKLDRLIAEKEKKLKELQKEYEQLQESLAELKLQIARSIEEGMKVKKRLAAKIKIKPKPSKPVLSPVKVKGITCNKLGICTATTNYGVIAVGEKLPTGEVVKEITPTYIRTDKRVIPF